MKSSWQLFPFSLGLLPEYVKHVPQLHFEIERYLFLWVIYSNIILSLDGYLLSPRKQKTMLLTDSLELLFLAIKFLG